MGWIFGSPTDVYGYQQSLLFVLLLLPVLMGATYLLLYYLVPRFLLKRRFFLFTLYTIYTFIAAAWMEMMIVMGLYVVVFNFQIESINPRITDLGYLSGTMVLVILPAISIQITRQWYLERQVNDRLKQEKLQLELYAREKELDFLKEQIRPHFLFNVLNNLYGLTLEKSDEAPNLVLKVSEMLDYMLYRSSGDLVTLEDELGHIKNYIDIQKIRCGDRLNLDLNLKTGLHGSQIAPMILLPFIENSFKHGISTTSANSHIRIDLDLRDNRLLFSVINSLGTAEPDTSDSGVGLSNVRKRLDLLYGEDYSLTTEQTDNDFRVNLSIPVTKKTSA